ncbi:MAG: MarR family transcriptional regulator [Pseudomonadota bacterium]
MSGKKQKAELDPTLIFEAVEFPDAYKISYLANAIIFPVYEDVLRDFGLFRAEYQLLMCLTHYAVLSSRDVAVLTRMPRNSISRAVSRMERNGYLTRTPNPDDRRKSKLAITPPGRQMHEKIAAYFATREREVLDALPARERAQFRALLSKLAVNASKLDR